MTKKQDRIPLENADNPLRKKAIRILEMIAEKLDKPRLFDCKDNNGTWYEFEDAIVSLLAEK